MWLSFNSTFWKVIFPRSLQHIVCTSDFFLHHTLYMRYSAHLFIPVGNSWSLMYLMLLIFCMCKHKKNTLAQTWVDFTEQTKLRSKPWPLFRCEQLYLVNHSTTLPLDNYSPWSETTTKYSDYILICIDTFLSVKQNVHLYFTTSRAKYNCGNSLSRYCHTQ